MLDGSLGDGDGFKLEKTVVVTGEGDDTNKVVVITEGGSIIVVGGGIPG